jgi:hypothetical protein
LEATAIQCKNIPDYLNDRTILENHFSKIAKVQRIFTRRSKKLAVVHFFDHVSIPDLPLVTTSLNFVTFFFFYYSYVHTRLGSFLPPAPTPSTPSFSPPPPQYPAETILPLFLINFVTFKHFFFPSSIDLCLLEYGVSTQISPY